VTARIRRSRLRRVAALGGMLAVVGGLVAVRTTLAPAPSQALAAPGLASAVDTPAAPRSPSASGAPHRRTHHPSAAPSTTSPVRPATRQVTGQAFDVGYGVVQVRVTLHGNRITEVRSLSLPQGGRSGDISSYAGPQLRREAISRQSARIDSVSGASYTSAGYARSLQSALDRSGS
jgi:uncharacterized protein with FMN-binding domain